MLTGNCITSVCNSVTSACNIILFQAMSILCSRIKECYTPRLWIPIKYVNCQANIYRLILTDFWELSIHVPTFENNPYMYWLLRIIRTCTDFSYGFLYWEKFVSTRVRIFGFEKLKNDEICMAQYVMNWCYSLQLH